MVCSTTTQPAVPRQLRLPRRTAAVALLLATVLPIAAPAQASRPESYTVKAGDTLWSLSRQFLGDPFLWPEIYRLNTLVVEDPHWIYPGEVLRLAQSDAVSAVPTTDTPLPSRADTVALVASVAPSPAFAPASPAPTYAAPSADDSTDMTPLFSQNRRNETMRETLRAYSDQPYRPLRRSEFYSSGFLTEGRDLPFGQLTGRVTPPQINVVSSRVSALLYTEVTLAPPSGATYRVGDSLLIVRLGADMPDFGRIVIPTGIVRVTDVANGRYVGSVIAVYGPIRNNQMLLPTEHFADAGTARAVAVADGVQARLLGGVHDRSLNKPLDVMFLDKGSKDGVAPGDIFELRRTNLGGGAKAIPEVMATLQVVRVGEHSATTRIISISSPDLPIGSDARQIAKLPS